MRKSASVDEVERDALRGYDYGQLVVRPSPVTLDDLQRIEDAAGWTAKDAEILERHGYAEAMVGAWRAVIDSQLHLDGVCDDGDGIVAENSLWRLGSAEKSCSNWKMGGPRRCSCT
jgi:hypothetical protein